MTVRQIVCSALIENSESLVAVFRACKRSHAVPSGGSDGELTL
jgi:hypothetical protein